MVRGYAACVGEAGCGNMGAGHFRNIPARAIFCRCRPRRPQDLHDDGLQPQDVPADEPCAACDDVHVFDFDDLASCEDPFAARLHNQIYLGDSVVQYLRAARNVAQVKIDRSASEEARLA